MSSTSRQKDSGGSSGKKCKSPNQSQVKAPAPLAPSRLPYKIFHCPLFLHQKHSHACVALRAKRICRMNCAEFFEWSKQNEETIKEIVKRHEAPIRDHLKRYELPFSGDLIESVMPKGENICEYCGKPFKTKGRLDGHLNKKHKRQLFMKKEAKNGRY